MRTREQIVADCEKRFQELRAEKERRDNDPKVRYPCDGCRFYREVGDDGYRWTVKQYRREYATCHEPLVKGFRKHGVEVRKVPQPCGPEKALWQPKLPMWRRVKQWWDADTGGWPTLIALAASALALGVTWLA